MDGWASSVCCKSTLAVVAFFLTVLTAISSVCLIILGIAVSDCDLTCDEGTDGAEPLNDGYYSCDGAAREGICSYIRPDLARLTAFKHLQRYRCAACCVVSGANLRSNGISSRFTSRGHCCAVGRLSAEGTH